MADFGRGGSTGNQTFAGKPQRYILDVVAMTALPSRSDANLVQWKQSMTSTLCSSDLNEAHLSASSDRRSGHRVTDRQLRILWIGKRPTNGEEGDEVFDRKTIAAWRRQGYVIDVFHPAPVSRAREIGNLLLGSPYQRARFTTGANIRSVRRLAGQYDVIICSWEPLDRLATDLESPVILIAHNISSNALLELFPRNPLAALASVRVRSWERHCYRPQNFAAVAGLSRKDHAYLQSIGAPKPLLLPPGMPPCLPLEPNAPVLSEIVISGTYDWSPKRRDLVLFAREYTGEHGRFPIRAHGLPDAAAHLLDPSEAPSPEESRSAIRFGLITDRFEAGHKLKTMAYIANNQIVLSFADVNFDFAHITDHDLFIRKVASTSDIAKHIKAVVDTPVSTIRKRFIRFQQACARYFTWDAVATTLMEAANTAVADRPFPRR
jgi:hypothetical protein